MGIGYRIIIKGTVQGVFFRKKAKTCADELHMKGSIKNLEDGRVEIILEGSSGDVTLLLHTLKERADSYHINDYTAEPLQLEKTFHSFEIIR
ncbi:MAG: acylphosphatase [Chlamydiales bacterium]|nr:acylphosphatase [Chlamydiales bacterium]